jgi:hypothetical protein
VDRSSVKLGGRQEDADGSDKAGEAGEIMNEVNNPHIGPSRASAFGRRNSGGSSNTEKITIEPQSNAPVRTAPAHPAEYRHTLNIPEGFAKALRPDKAQTILEVFRKVRYTAAQSPGGKIQHWFQKRLGQRTDAHKLEDALQWFTKNCGKTAVPDLVDNRMHLHKAHYKNKPVRLTFDDNETGVTQNIYTVSHYLAGIKTFRTTLDELRGDGWSIEYHDCKSNYVNPSRKQLSFASTNPAQALKNAASLLSVYSDPDKTAHAKDAARRAHDYFLEQEEQHPAFQIYKRWITPVMLKCQKQAKDGTTPDIYEAVKQNFLNEFVLERNAGRPTPEIDLPGLTRADGVNIYLYRHMHSALNHVLRTGAEEGRAAVEDLTAHINASLRKYPSYEGWAYRVLGGRGIGQVEFKDLKRYWEAHRNNTVVTEQQFTSWTTDKSTLKSFSPQESPANIEIESYLRYGYDLRCISQHAEILSATESNFRIHEMTFTIDGHAMSKDRVDKMFEEGGGYPQAFEAKMTWVEVRKDPDGGT